MCRKTNVVKKRVCLTLCCLIISKFSFGSDFGVTGLIDIPTARMLNDGNLSVTAAIQSQTNSYSLTYQATPWLETSFRYTGFNEFFLWDRNFETKLQLVTEGKYFPQVAMGIRDVFGTGVWGAEYLVASKKISEFDFTLGLGWGRLAGVGDFDNPLIKLSKRLAERDTEFGLGGTLSYDSFFAGKQVGIFGGLSYEPSNMPIKIMLEYNPDEYEREFQLGSLRPKSPITSAIELYPSEGISLKLSRQHMQEWGLELTVNLDTKSGSSRVKKTSFRSSLDYTQDQLPVGIMRDKWYDTLLFDVERSGIQMLEATLDHASKTAYFVIRNLEYNLVVDAIARFTKLADIHLPDDITKFNITIDELGHRLHTVSLVRPSLDYNRNYQIRELEIRINEPQHVDFAQYKTNFLTNKTYFDVNLATRFQFFDPDDPARHQVYAKIDISRVLPREWFLIGSYGINLTHNFDESSRVSDSVLPRVRTEVVKYLNEGESGLESLYLQKRGSLSNNLHYRIFSGILESMYSGVGGELLFSPYRSRLALGVSANIVKKRDYDKSFKHLDYQTNTAFASAYWATPFYNYDVAIHLGRYLAGDRGATFEVRRTFDNGWMVGLWATTTNVSAEDFGEGSFDKGLFFRIPLASLKGFGKKVSFTTRIRPVQRDGGQRLDDFSSNIWWDIRSARYDALANKKRVMIQ